VHQNLGKRKNEIPVENMLGVEQKSKSLVAGRITARCGGDRNLEMRHRLAVGGLKELEDLTWPERG
jgi:hypothetical protein